MEKPIEIGNHNLISRVVSIPAGQTVVLFDVNVDIEQGWQFIYQVSDDSDSGTITLKTHTNLADFEQRFDWGASTGDFITGKGAFRIEASNSATPPANDSTIAGYITTENFIDSVQSFTETVQIFAVAGAFADVGTFGGFCPFPYNAFSLITTNPIDIQFVSSAAVVSATYLAVPQRDRLLFQTSMPKSLRLQAAGTVPNQPVTVQWTRV